MILAVGIFRIDSQTARLRPVFRRKPVFTCRRARVDGAGGTKVPLLGFGVAVDVVVVVIFCVPPLLVLCCVTTPAMQAMTSNARKAIAKPWQNTFLQGAIALSRI